MISCLTIFIITFTIQSSLIICDNPCRYESEKGIINLSSVGRTNEIATYIDIIPPTEHKYSMLILILIKIVYFINYI